MVYGQQKHVKVESVITFANFVHLLIQHTQLGLSSRKSANSRSRSYRTSNQTLFGLGHWVFSTQAGISAMYFSDHTPTNSFSFLKS